MPLVRHTRFFNAFERGTQVTATKDLRVHLRDLLVLIIFSRPT